MTRKRIDELGMEKIQKLAHSDNEYREEMKKEGVSGESIKKLAETYSNRVLENIEIERKSLTDPLTGMENRRALNTNIPQIIEVEERAGQKCSLLMIDIDNFKNINDEYGHDTGDDVLKQAAEIIKNNIRRQSDFSYRYGGEEFVVFLTNTTSEKTAEIAEKIRKNIEKNIFKTSSNDGKKLEIKLSVSIGVAGTDQKIYNKKEPEKLEKILKAADTAMYQSKKEGKNRATIFSKDSIITKQ